MSKYLDAYNARQQEKSLSVKGIEIFRAGEHRPMNGSSFLFSTSMLNDVVTSYQPGMHHAPVVIGHPKTDAPAYGWVSDIRIEGDTLVADFSDIDTEFAQLVKSKRYRKISASFWQPSSISNPHKGQWALKHVGFLGAAAPAVKGLKEANFTVGEDGVVVFGEDDTFDLPVEYALTIQRHENVVRVEQLISEGRILPIHQEQIMDFASALDNSEAVSFTDGSEQGKRDWFLNFLSQLPPIVNFGSHEISASQSLDHTTNNAPYGFCVDPDGQALQLRANELAKVENISFEEAVSRVAGQ